MGINWPRNTALYNWFFQGNLSHEIDYCIARGLQVKDQHKLENKLDKEALFNYWAIIIILAFALYVSGNALLVMLG